MINDPWGIRVQEKKRWSDGDRLVLVAGKAMTEASNLINQLGSELNERGLCTQI